MRILLLSVLLLTAGCGTTGPKELTDSDGQAVPREVARIRRGDSHCDWESVTILRLGQRQYIADPKRKIVPGPYADQYAASVPVPVDAVDTGYRSGKLQVFEAKDMKFAYLSNGTTAQRLPVAAAGFGCD